MRAVVLRWTVAILTAALGLFVAPSPLALVDPSPCHGLIQAISIALARVSTETTAAGIVARLNGVAVFGALVLFGHLAYRHTASAIATVAVTLAFASTSMFVRALAPSPAFAVLVVALAGLAWFDRDTGSATTRRQPLFLTATALLVSIAVPTLTVPIAIALLLARGRAWMAGGVVLAGVAGILLLPTLASPESIAPERRLTCLIPFSTATNPWSVSGLIVSDAGPAAIAAVLLGLFQVRRSLRTRQALALVAVAAAPILMSGRDDVEARFLLAPMWSTFWLLAGCGLTEMLSALQTTWARRSVAIAIALMVPLLQVSRVRSPEPAPADRVRGHDLLTASSLSRLLAVTPAGAVLIVDDALTDLLARSQAGTRRLTSRHVRFVKADSRAIESLLASHRVFALPRAQYTLGHSGFDLRTDLQPRVDGLAQVVSRKPCRDLTPAWADVPELVDATQLALVADQPEARGPIVIYLGLGEHSEPRAIDWPRAALRGLSGRTYDRRRPGDAGDLARQRELDAAPDAPLFAAPIVVRLALWRVPGGPMILPVDVGTPVRGAITRSPREEPPDLALCPSTIGEIERVR